MKIVLGVIAVFLAVFSGAGLVHLLGGKEPVAVIFDTDLSSDVDDVGAVAVLHSLVNEKKAEILAMMISSADPWSPACLRALNRFFGRGDIPIGQVARGGIVDTSKYTRQIGEEFGTDATSRKTTTEDAVSLYRRTLASSPPHSVTIISVGYLTNLANLLGSSADALSPLSGKELVAAKVARLVVMGGQYPEGREWNFYRDSAATTTVVAQWPTEIRFCGYELGVNIPTGAALQDSPQPNPVRRSYELYNGLIDRPSWDQLTVLLAVGSRDALGRRKVGESVRTGVNRVEGDGSNYWMEGKGKHGYFLLPQSQEKLRTIIDHHMRRAVRLGFDRDQKEER